MRVTQAERGWLSLLRYNRLTPVIETRQTTTIGRIKVEYKCRSRKNLMGRFGGGWNWVLGVQVGSTTVIVNLLVCSVRFELNKEQPNA